MDANKEGKKMKNKIELKPRTLSLEEKNELAKNEENELEKQIQDLKTWTDEIAAMNDEQLVEYLKNRPPELKTVQRVRKSKPPKYTGILASVMKFHKDDDEESSAKPDA
ncbi:hypothetical protein KPL71_016521 [Citrus sinensis]|uniref:Uncharacterized protein n=1 Tax=Citrus sinensis TaxID=2711 RepID=A0ACB8KTV5_CITSI|nr:hypothetical protein KPL71_016521 [Citrus sinensis]